MTDIPKPGPHLFPKRDELIEEHPEETGATTEDRDLIVGEYDFLGRSIIDDGITGAVVHVDERGGYLLAVAHNQRYFVPLNHEGSVTLASDGLQAVPEDVPATLSHVVVSDSSRSDGSRGIEKDSGIILYGITQKRKGPAASVYYTVEGHAEMCELMRENEQQHPVGIYYKMQGANNTNFTDIVLAKGTGPSSTGTLSFPSKEARLAYIAAKEEGTLSSSAVDNPLELLMYAKYSRLPIAENLAVLKDDVLKTVDEYTHRALMLSELMMRIVATIESGESLTIGVEQDGDETYLQKADRKIDIKSCYTLDEYIRSDASDEDFLKYIAQFVPETPRSDTILDVPKLMRRIELKTRFSTRKLKQAISAGITTMDGFQHPQFADFPSDIVADELKQALEVLQPATDTIQQRKEAETIIENEYNEFGLPPAEMPLHAVPVEQILPLLGLQGRIQRSDAVVTRIDKGSAYVGSDSWDDDDISFHKNRVGSLWVDTYDVIWVNETEGGYDLAGSITAKELLWGGRGDTVMRAKLSKLTIGRSPKRLVRVRRQL